MEETLPKGRITYLSIPGKEPGRGETCNQRFNGGTKTKHLLERLKIWRVIILTQTIMGKTNLSERVYYQIRGGRDARE